MKNKVFEQVMTKIEALTKEKNEKYADLQAALEVAYIGLEQAEKESDQFMREGNLKKYAEAETKRGFYNKRISLLTNQINHIDDGNYITKDEYKKMCDMIKDEQEKLIKAQFDKMQQVAKDTYQMARETTGIIGEGNKVIVAINTELYARSVSDNWFADITSNSEGENIADNFRYDLECRKNLPVKKHRNSLRYSKYLGSVPFADEV